MIVLGYSSELIQRFLSRFPEYDEKIDTKFSRSENHNTLTLDVCALETLENYKQHFSVSSKIIIVVSPKILIEKIECLDTKSMHEQNIFTNGVIEIINFYINTRLDEYKNANIMIINSDYIKKWQKGNFLYLNHMQTLVNYQRSVELELSSYDVSIENFYCGPVSTKFQKTKNGIEFLIEENLSQNNFDNLCIALKDFFDVDI